MCMYTHVCKRPQTKKIYMIYSSVAKQKKWGEGINSTDAEASQGYGVYIPFMHINSHDIHGWVCMILGVMIIHPMIPGLINRGNHLRRTASH